MFGSCQGGRSVGLGTGCHNMKTSLSSTAEVGLVRRGIEISMLGSFWTYRHTFSIHWQINGIGNIDGSNNALRIYNQLGLILDLKDDQ